MQNLVTRTRDFALNAIRVYDGLPRGRVAYALGCQFLNAATSPGAHFREALRARSKAEYVSKLNGGLMELEETLYWLELLVESHKAKPDDVEGIKKEAEELIAIFVSLIKKWKV